MNKIQKPGHAPLRRGGSRPLPEAASRGFRESRQQQASQTSPTRGWMMMLLAILLPMMMLQATQAAAQAIQVKLVPAATTLVYPGSPVTVTYNMVRTGTIPNPMEALILLVRGNDVTLLASVTHTTTGTKFTDVVIPAPHLRAPDGWRIYVIERTQADNLVQFSTDEFSINQAPPNLSFTGHNGTSSGDFMIVSKTTSGTIDSPLSSADTPYVKFVLQNTGDATQSGMLLKVEIDSVTVQDGIGIEDMPGRSAYGYGPVVLPKLTPGVHSIRLTIHGGGAHPVSVSTSESVTASSAVNLEIYTPPGYSGPLVLSTVALATSGQIVFSASTPVYVAAAAFVNKGQAAATPFRLRLLLDNSQVGTPVTYPGLAAGEWDALEGVPLGLLTPGNHTVAFQIDDLNQVQEYDETPASNRTTVTITVQAPAITVEKGGSALAEGDTVAFPLAALGSSQTLSLKVTNSGTERLDFAANAIGISGPAAGEFDSPGWSGATVAPGASIQLPLRFTPSATGSRNATLRLKSNAWGPAAEYDLSLSATGQRNLEGWLNANFPGHGPDDVLSDGIPLILKYATGAQAGVMPGVLGQSGTDLTLSFDFTKAAIADGIPYVVVWSDDLKTWSTEGVTFVPASDAGDRVKVLAKVPRGSAGQRFLRLLVEP